MKDLQHANWYIHFIKADYRMVVVNGLLPCGVIVILTHWRRLGPGFNSR